jgi:hypothetical protein
MEMMRKMKGDLKRRVHITKRRNRGRKCYLVPPTF